MGFLNLQNIYSATLTYTYDDLHRLSSVTQENCTQTYTYDEAGNRTVKVVTRLDSSYNKIFSVRDNV